MLKQKFVETLSWQGGGGQRFAFPPWRPSGTPADSDVGASEDVDLDEILHLVEKLKPLCSVAQFNSLCLFLTLERLDQHPEYTAWTVSEGRWQCFVDLCLTLCPLLSIPFSALSKGHLCQSLAMAMAYQATSGTDQSAPALLLANKLLILKRFDHVKPSPPQFLPSTTTKLNSIAAALHSRPVEQGPAAIPASSSSAPPPIALHRGLSDELSLAATSAWPQKVAYDLEQTKSREEKESLSLIRSNSNEQRSSLSAKQSPLSWVVTFDDDAKQGGGGRPAAKSRPSTQGNVSLSNSFEKEGFERPPSSKGAAPRPSMHANQAPPLPLPSTNASDAYASNPVRRSSTDAPLVSADANPPPPPSNAADHIAKSGAASSSKSSPVRKPSTTDISNQSQKKSVKVSSLPVRRNSTDSVSKNTAQPMKYPSKSFNLFQAACPVRCISVLSDGPKSVRVCVGSNAKSVHVLGFQPDVLLPQTLAVESEIENVHKGSVYAMDWQAELGLLVSGSNDKLLRVTRSVSSSLTYVNTSYTYAYYTTPLLLYYQCNCILTHHHQLITPFAAIMTMLYVQAARW